LNGICAHMLLNLIQPFWYLAKHTIVNLMCEIH
jgi:hypothetical protein